MALYLPVFELLSTRKTKKINQKSIGECGIRTCDHRISNTENFSNFHWLLLQILLIFKQDFYKHIEILSTRFCNISYIHYLWILQIFCSTIKLQKFEYFPLFLSKIFTDIFAYQCATEFVSNFYWLSL